MFHTSFSYSAEMSASVFQMLNQLEAASEAFMSECLNLSL